VAGASVLAWASKGVADSLPSEELGALKKQYTRPAAVPAPDDNPITPAKVELGRKLFFDPRISGSGVISCGSCHNPSLGWEDGLAFGVGHGGGKLGRHTPTILNVAWGGPYFWDGRAATLEDQAKGPIESPAEMNMSHGDAVARVKGIAGYQAAFAQVFPNEGVTIDTVAKAIATYERTVVSGEAPFDRWINGDEDAISEKAKRGFVLFNTKANCAVCHTGWRFTDDGFHDIGISGTDEGRAKVAPRIEQLRFAFKTPTLRNIADRAPYLHDGSARTLEAVVDLYNNPTLERGSRSTEVKPLGLTAEEKGELVAFLKTLSSEDPPQPFPNLPK
jgi:cytochrome c peroxidase